MVTIQDIANKSGVAMSTVSRALADSPKISVKTKERIKKMAQDMGYTPNFAARNLTQRESNTVGVVLKMILPCNYYLVLILNSLRDNTY